MNCVVETTRAAERRSVMIARLTEELRWANSYSRAGVLVKFYPRCNRLGLLDEYFRLAGGEWSGCDNLGVYQLEFRLIFQSNPGRWPLLMSENDRAVWSALPDIVDLFRGCGPGNRMGLSWSLDRAVAEKFPQYVRYRQQEPSVLHARVKKADVVAYFSERDESEVVAFVTEADVVAETKLEGGLSV